MEEEINISVEIYPKEKVVYIAEECSSGAKYKFKNVKDLAEKIHFYLDSYYKKEIEGTKESENEIESLEDYTN